MADQKLTALGAIAAATADDIIYLVDDPLGVPGSRKITFDNFQKSITDVGNIVTGTWSAAFPANSINADALDWGVGVGQISAVDIPIADGGGIITGTEVETALQENRTAIDLNTTDSHAEIHTIVSHDTSATGAELDSLTDNSIVNALHRHSELVASDGAPDPAVSVDADGNVGIGTVSPIGNLDVAKTSSGGIGGIINIRNTAVSAADNAVTLGFKNSPDFITTFYSARLTSAITAGGNGSHLAFHNWTGAAEIESMRIDKDGNVGIGVAAPNELLHVMGTQGSGIIRVQGKSNTAGHYTGLDFCMSTDPSTIPKAAIYFERKGAAGTGSWHLANDIVVDANPVQLSDAKLTIANDGNVGIGVTDPHSKLEVNGAISSATLNITTANDETIAVGGVNYLFINSSGGNITINDFTGGVVGQIVHILVSVPDASNTILINHLSGSNQQLYLHSAGNYTFAVNERGGFMFVCDGTNWHDCSHAKHV